MPLITGLPTNSSPSTSDYVITEDGSATYKSTIANLKAAMDVIRSISNPGDADDTSLWGRFWSAGSNCSNLPSSSSGAYFWVFCFGTVQIAIQHSDTAPIKIWARDYINSQWYSWSAAGMSTSGNASTSLYSNSSGLDITSGSTVTLSQDYSVYKFLMLTIYRATVSSTTKSNILIPCAGLTGTGYYPICAGTYMGVIRITAASSTSLPIASATLSDGSTVLLGAVVGIL